MNLNLRRGLGVSLGLSIIAIMIVIAFTFDQDTIDNLGLIRPGFLLLALGLLLLAIAVEGGRIAFVANIMGGSVSWRQGIAIFLTTSFAALVTPMGMGELPTLAIMYAKAGLNTGLAAAAAVARSFITKLVFLSAIIYLFGFQRSRVQFGLITDNVFSVMALVFFITVLVNASYVLFPGLVTGLWRRMPQRWQRGRFARWQNRLDFEAREFDRGINVVWRKHPLSLIIIGLMSGAYWTLYFGILPVLSRGLGVLVDPVLLVSRQFVLTLALPFIPLPGGSGALELAMVAAYQGLIPRAFISIFVLSWRLFTFYLLVLLGALAALRNLWRK
ncbi:MAG: flippase-like domain-containing protein [Firmicutes bacterium]|nr:flippase-like domain-containing protein [Bacillota bacterium]